jgi:hypothetical protein
MTKFHSSLWQNKIPHFLNPSISSGHLGCFYSLEMVSKLMRLPKDWEKIFASYTSDKGLMTRIDW